MKTYFSPFVQWLCCCFLFIGCMLALRIIYAGNIRYVFLVWNLFLACIPYWISISFSGTAQKTKLLQIFLFASWLVFFPNALYVVTDLIHLTKKASIPIWFDVVLLFTSSFLGIVLAFASLLNVEKFISMYFKKQEVNIIVLLLIFAGSYGVYLGRFERWNSWDVINNPRSIALDILETFINPLDNTHVWSVIFLLTGLYSLFWYLIKTLTLQIRKNRLTNNKMA